MLSGIGVCSWSLRPESPAELAAAMQRLGIERCQLALVPAASRGGPWTDAARILCEAGIEIISGMLAMRGEDYSTLDSIRRTGGVALDERWGENRALAHEVAKIAREWGIELVTFHAGFIPHKPSRERNKLIARVQAIADSFAHEGVAAALETGQETAATLLEALHEMEGPVGVNLDPANMILYGMGDPVDAVRVLGPHIVQVHIKDALPTAEPGTWGREVPVGEGSVDWDTFLKLLADLPQSLNLVIEREAGPTRERDIAQARDLILQHMQLEKGTEALRHEGTK